MVFFERTKICKNVENYCNSLVYIYMCVYIKMRGWLREMIRKNGGEKYVSRIFFFV